MSEDNYYNGRKRKLREPKSHQRRWECFNVDSNLKDDWLERLNALKHFDMTSICEGLGTRDGELKLTEPHIVLRMKQEFLPAIEEWEYTHDMLAGALEELFDTKENIFSIHMDHVSIFNGNERGKRRKLTINMHRRSVRDAEEMDRDTDEWFEGAVERIEKMDEMFEADEVNENEQKTR